MPSRLTSNVWDDQKLSLRHVRDEHTGAVTQAGGTAYLFTKVRDAVELLNEQAARRRRDAIAQVAGGTTRRSSSLPGKKSRDRCKRRQRKSVDSEHPGKHPTTVAALHAVSRSDSAGRQRQTSDARLPS